MAYRWVQREEQVGSTRLSLECIDDFEAEVAAFCDRMLSEGRSYAEFEDLCPMFGALWPVARALAWRVDEVGSGLAGRRVLELGCGLGLPSLVAARHGALVVATDQHPDAGPLLGRNAATNGVAGLRYVSFDWRGRAPAEAPEHGFEHVLASDVLYAASMPERVAATVARFLAPGGTAWVTDPGRPWLDGFVEQSRQHGLSAELDLYGQGDHEAFLVTLRA